MKFGRFLPAFLMFMKEYQNYIFDLYGTLLDIRTDESSYKFWNKVSQTLQLYGVVMTPVQCKKKYQWMCRKAIEKKVQEAGHENVEIDLAELFAQWFPEDARTPKKIQAFMTLFRYGSTKYLRLFDHTVSTLEALKQNGKKIFLLSNAQEGFTLNELKGTKIYDYFDAIYISSQYGIKKPCPQFMQQLLDDQSIKIEESVMTGNDFSSDIAIANALEMDSIFLNTDHHSHAELEMLNKKNPATYIIEDGDVAKILGG